MDSSELSVKIFPGFGMTASISANEMLSPVGWSLSQDNSVTNTRIRPVRRERYGDHLLAHHRDSRLCGPLWQVLRVWFEEKSHRHVSEVCFWERTTAGGERHNSSGTARMVGACLSVDGDDDATGHFD